MAPGAFDGAGCRTETERAPFANARGAAERLIVADFADDERGAEGRLRAVRAHVAGEDRERAARRHRIARIEREMAEQIDDFAAPRACHRGGGTGERADFEADGRAEQRAQLGALRFQHTAKFRAIRRACAGGVPAVEGSVAFHRCVSLAKYCVPPSARFPDIGKSCAAFVCKVTFSSRTAHSYALRALVDGHDEERIVSCYADALFVCHGFAVDRSASAGRVVFFNPSSTVVKAAALLAKDGLTRPDRIARWYANLPRRNVEPPPLPDDIEAIRAQIAATFPRD